MSVTYAEIWKKLSAIDCSNHTEKKGNLTYLSWVWAWGIMMEHYPDATFSFWENQVFSDGTVMVFCTVKIGDCARTMWLPVMDYKNKAISNPDSFAVNTAMMRCLVKCLSFYGLGHYIYAGEDLPEKQPAQSQVEAFGEVATLDDLQALWASLSSEDKKICTGLKNDAKARLS